MHPLRISATTLASCLGFGLEDHRQAMRQRFCGLTPCHFETVELDTWCGQIDSLDSVAMPASLQDYDCRNNRVAEAALRDRAFVAAIEDAVARHGPQRIGVFIGSSTSGILETEIAYRHLDANGRLQPGFEYSRAHNYYSSAAFVRARFGLRGPAFVTSAACASSAKVFGSASRMIAAGLIDAAIVGGVDSLCLTTLHGFDSLQLLSPGPCRPYDAQRAGISVAEAAGFALVEPMTPADADRFDCVVVAGIGESSDAHHMSSPHPQGAGALAAMREALQQAAIEPERVDYVNLHGTGTASNDAAEDKAVHALFGSRVPVSSTKGATGHTLGAAGIVEAVLSMIAVQTGIAPAGLNVTQLDPALKANYLLENLPVKGGIDVVLSNSFGFGGSNCALLIGRAPLFARNAQWLSGPQSEAPALDAWP